MQGLEKVGCRLRSGTGFPFFLFPYRVRLGENYMVNVVHEKQLVWPARAVFDVIDGRSFLGLCAVGLVYLGFGLGFLGLLLRYLLR